MRAAHGGLIIKCQTDTPYSQEPNLGEDNDGLLGPKKDKYKVCSLLNKAPPNFGSAAAFSCQFCQALRYQNRSKGLVCHYINIDAMLTIFWDSKYIGNFSLFLNPVIIV